MNRDQVKAYEGHVIGTKLFTPNGQRLPNSTAP